MNHILFVDSTGTARIDAMPLLLQSDARIAGSPYSAAGIAGADCYDAAISMVSQAVLASRDLTLFPKASGRTQTFLDIGDTGQEPDVISAAYNRLAWQTNVAGGPDAFYFPEIIADFEPIYQPDINPRVYEPGTPVAVTSEHCATFRDWVSLDTVHIVDHYVKGLLDQDFAVIISFQWATPVATPLSDGWRVSFTAGHGHKVAISGYRSGPFPLRVFDDGTGTERWASLRSDFTDRDFGQSGVSGPAISEVDYDAKLQGRFRLAWEDAFAADQDASFVDHIDAFSMYWNSPKQVFSWQWGSGWTIFAPFVESGQQSQIAYDTTTGLVHFDRMLPNGSYTVWSSTWAAGWTHLVPFVNDEQDYFFAYNQATGDVQFSMIYPGLDGHEILWADRWDAGWSHLAAIEVEGAPHFIAYNTTTGWIRVDEIHVDVNGTTTRRFELLGAGFTTISPLVRDGWSEFISYNSDTGQLRVDRISGDGTSPAAAQANDLLLDKQLDTTFPSGYVLAALQDRSALSQPHFVAYNRATGDLRFARIQAGIGGAASCAVLWSGSGSAGSSSLMPFQLDSRWYTFLYDQASGDLAYFSLSPL